MGNVRGSVPVETIWKNCVPEESQKSPQPDRDDAHLRSWSLYRRRRIPDACWVQGLVYSSLFVVGRGRDGQLNEAQ
jgi:hypothetical protein